MPRSSGLGRVDAWIFDLDNTLYRTTGAIVAQTDELMGSFVGGFLGVGREEARRVQKHYFRTYGLTLRGLMVEHGLDPDRYREHMARLDLSELAPDEALVRAIDRLPGRKLVHTNAFAGHADEVLGRIGLEGRFEAVFDIAAAGYVPKPAIAPYRQLCARHGVDPGRAAMVEDIAGNLAPAARLGMATVWLRSDQPWARDGADAGHVDHVADDLAAWLDEAAREST